MKITELRIGNLVLDEDGCYMYIGAIKGNSKSDTVEDSAGNEVKVSSLNSISLDWEMLEKQGFKPARPNSGVLLLPIAFEDSDYPCTLQLSGSGLCVARSGVGAITAPVFYLHQLQNLYYALTGQELEVKL